MALNLAKLRPWNLAKEFSGDTALVPGIPYTSGCKSLILGRPLAAYERLRKELFVKLASLLEEPSQYASRFRMVCTGPPRISTRLGDARAQRARDDKCRVYQVLPGVGGRMALPGVPFPSRFTLYKQLRDEFVTFPPEIVRTLTPSDSKCETSYEYASLPFEEKS